MTRLPLWAQYLIGVALFAFGILGVTNSVHLAAKIFYAVLIAGSTVVLTLAVSQRSATQ